MESVEELTPESQLRDHRQRRLDLLEKNRDAAREHEELDAAIKAKTAKLDDFMNELDELKLQRRMLERKVPESVVLENYLRQNPTPWVAARQREIAREAKELHGEIETRQETLQWINDRLKYPPRGTQEELEVNQYRKRRVTVEDEVAKLKERVRVIREEEGQLVKRLLTEAWPNGPLEVAPKAATRNR